MIEFQDNTPPEWMIALENKKRHHKLAHEIGAGALCLNCDGCVGLDLHFWRKICRNCKCKREVHDVKEENNFEQFEILFGDNLKCNDRVKKISLDLKDKLDDIFVMKEIQTKDSNSYIKTDNDLMFDWFPSNVPVNLASEYLIQLPLEKLPITGSAGAMFRRQQLQKQMPLHDFKVNNCHDLTDEETRAFSEYVDNLKHNVVGKGQITKILLPLRESDDTHSMKMHLPNNLNSTPTPFKSFVENTIDEDKFLSPPSKLLHPAVELKTPSAFISQYKIPINKSACTNLKNISKSLNENPVLNKYDNGECINDLATECWQKLNIDKKLDAENNNLTSSNNIHEFNMTQATALETNQLKTENNCDTIKNPNKHREKSSYLNKNEVATANVNVPSLQDFQHYKNITPESVKNIDGKFLKLGNPEHFVAFSSNVLKPQMSNVLIMNSKGKDKNQNQKIRLCNTITPYVDQSIQPHQHISKEPNVLGAVMDAEFINLQNESEISCHQCKLTIFPDQVVVVAERAGVEVIWHPQCFICFFCKELLVDLVYFFHHGEVYCGRHYAEVLKIPRCFACDELIFLREYTVAEGQSFHIKHFCCFECDIPLAGQNYIPKDNNPICLPCYESKYGKQCRYCEETIKAKDSRIGWKELSWHATEVCFKCIQCSKSLLGNKFVIRNNNPLCSKDCIMKYDAANHK